MIMMYQEVLIHLHVHIRAINNAGAKRGCHTIGWDLVTMLQRYAANGATLALDYYRPYNWSALQMCWAPFYSQVATTCLIGFMCWSIANIKLLCQFHRAQHRLHNGPLPIRSHLAFFYPLNNPNAIFYWSLVRAILSLFHKMEEIWQQIQTAPLVKDQAEMRSCKLMINTQKIIIWLVLAVRNGLKIQSTISIEGKLLFVSVIQCWMPLRYEVYKTQTLEC